MAAIFVWVLLIVLDGRTIMSWNDLESRGDFDPWSWTLGAPNDLASLLTFSGDVERGLLLDVEVHKLGYILASGARLPDRGSRVEGDSPAARVPLALAPRSP